MGSLTWTYSDTGANGEPTLSLTVTTSDTLQSGTYAGLNGPIVYSYYTVTSVSGTFNGTAITGLDPIRDSLGANRIYTTQDHSTGQTPVFDGLGGLSDGNNLQLSLSSGDDLALGSGEPINGGNPPQFGLLAPDTSTYANPAYPFTLVNSGLLNALSFVPPPCFAAGTRIATPAGEVVVEQLAPGDAVLLARGGSARVRWVGRREVRCDRHPKPQDAWPVRIAADAFGPGAPHRDLWLSPDHAVFVPAASGQGGMLVPVRYLVNGATVRQEQRERVTYLHVELERHDVLLADGLPCESYLDTGNRGAFANGGSVAQAHPDFALAVWQAKACAKLVTDGPRLAALRRRLLARATAALGHALSDDPGLLVSADDVPLTGRVRGERWEVDLPEGAREVLLASRTFVPAETVAGATDPRRLGVAIGAIARDGAALALDDARLGAGWYPVEGAHRWTDGAARIDVRGVRRLTVTLAIVGRYWQPAAATAAAAA